MELQNYVYILIRRKMVVLITLFVTIAGVLIGSAVQTPLYEATTILRVAVSVSGVLTYSSTNYATQLLNTTAQIATSSLVLDELMQKLNLSEPPEVTAEVISSTELIKITILDKDPLLVVQEANTLAEILTVRSNEVYTGGGKNSPDILNKQLSQVEQELIQLRQQYEAALVKTPPVTQEIDLLYQDLLLKQRNYETLLSQYQESVYLQEMRSNMITVVEKPVVPKSPAKPNIIFNSLLGFTIGLVGGIIAAFLVEAFDTTLTSAEDIEKVSQMQAFARIPRVKKNEKALSSNSNSPFTEAFRDLALNVQRVSRQNPLKVLVVFSPQPDEGKSLVVAHLAVHLADIGKKVVVVDCDLRLPTQHHWFNLSNAIGLRDVLEGTSNLEDALQKTTYDGLSVMTSGALVMKPALLFASDPMPRIIEELSRHFDYVLLDTPAFLVVGEVAVVSEWADGLFLVACRDRTKRKALQAASEFLKRIPAKFNGLIINQDANRFGYYYYSRVRRI
ncbi:MAG: polysaccharide biosynthesis tyrosine autokinase [Anaerolineales bacterium]|nr:polysaccharide biosynthesis tyrosine autokinase [Anaerolineales bacterium]